MGKSFDKRSISASIKSRKIFEKKDIFIYLLLAVIILALFIPLMLPQKPAKGFSVSIDGKTLLTHYYSGDFDITSEYAQRVEITKDGDGYLIKITFDDGFNQLIVDEKACSVKMKDSDCPSKNCVHTAAITSSGAIYCAPRKLKIAPLSDSEFIPPTSGGVV